MTRALIGVPAGERGGGASRSGRVKSGRNCACKSKLKALQLEAGGQREPEKRCERVCTEIVHSCQENHGWETVGLTHFSGDTLQVSAITGAVDETVVG